MKTSQQKSSKISGFFNKFFSSSKPKKHRAAFFVLLAVLVLGVSVKSSLAGPIGAEMDAYVKKASQIQTDAGGNKYVTVGVVNYYVSEKYGQDGIDLGGNWVVVGGGAFDAKVREDVNAQADRGELKLQSTPSGTITYNDVKNEAKTDIASAALSALLAPVIAVLFAIVYFLKIFVNWSAMVLDFVLNPNFYNFTSNSMIVQGWTMVRDVCNLFFLLVLLFIAICTILKIEKYHAKKTLLMLIIMALLINFSKPIAIFVFDGSQLLMNEFLKQMGNTNNQGQTGSTMVTKATEISEMIYKSIPEYFGESKNTSIEIFVSYLFATVFLFMFAVALLVTAIFLIIRIVVIMLLIIVSPFAFFAAIIPDFSKMSSQWWSSLFEYSYYGPAAAFFLLLATKLSSVLPEITKVQDSGVASFNRLSTNIIHYLVVLIFLYASIFMAKKFGGGAGAAVVGNANRFMRWAAPHITGYSLLRAGAGNLYTRSGIGQAYNRVRENWNRRAENAGRRRGERMAGLLGVEPTSEFGEMKRNAKERFEHMGNSEVRRLAEAGDVEAFYEATQRNIVNDQMLTNQQIIDALVHNEDLRTHAISQMRKSGQKHQALALRQIISRIDPTTESNAVRNMVGNYRDPNNHALGNITLGEAVAINELGRDSLQTLFKDQNVEELINNPDANFFLDGRIQALIAQSQTVHPAGHPNANQPTPEALVAQQQLSNILLTSTSQNTQYYNDNII